LINYGNDWKKVQKNIQTRSSTQARSHAQKFFINVKKKIKKNYQNGEKSEKKQRLYVKVIYDIISQQLMGADNEEVTNQEIQTMLCEKNIKKIILNVLNAMRVNKKIGFEKLIEDKNKDELIECQIESIMDCNTLFKPDFDKQTNRKVFIIQKVKKRKSKSIITF